MNYLSHLYFSQRTPLSMAGNLMGDFKPSKELRKSLPSEIKLGIKNHRLVDRLTDQYEPVKQLKTLFKPSRRRYAGIVTDISYDYFLIKHWQRFEQQSLDEFVQHCYGGLNQTQQWMPSRMQLVVTKMHEHDWLSAYGSMDGIAKTIDQVSKRIRFDNNLAGSVIEIERNYHAIEEVFLDLFVHLQEHVAVADIEA